MSLRSLSSKFPKAPSKCESDDFYKIHATYIARSTRCGLCNNTGWRLVCHQCLGTGKYDGPCMQCRGHGIILYVGQQIINCAACRGHGIYPFTCARHESISQGSNLATIAVRCSCDHHEASSAREPQDAEARRHSR